jgi:hypothetical protein
MKTLWFVQFHSLYNLIHGNTLNFKRNSLLQQQDDI